MRKQLFCERLKVIVPRASRNHVPFSNRHILAVTRTLPAMTNSSEMPNSFIYIYSPFSKWLRKSPLQIVDFLKSALIEGDGLLFSWSSNVLVILMKSRPVGRDQLCCFFAAARLGRHASPRRDRRGGPVTVGFWARPVCGGIVSCVIKSICRC